MTKSLGKKIWIDDNQNREVTARELGYEFVNARETDLEREIPALLTGKERRQVVLDHWLDTPSNNPVFKRGSTIAAAIKEAWPSCPVVGVTTGMTQFNKISQRTRHTYDAFFPYDELSKYLDEIESIESGFLLIRKSAPAKANEIVELLKPPDSERGRLLEALPHDLKTLDQSVASRLYRWVNHLRSRPGFLYNDLWAATLLGLNKSGLERVRDTFKKAHYAGVFSVKSDARWWASSLTEMLYKKEEPKSGEFSWNVGRRLEGITRRYFSECYVCDDNENPPDTVAFLDRESPESESQPMHVKHTVLHPDFKRELFFEDVRMMSKER